MMKRYYIELCRESVPQVRELSNEEYNLISSIFEVAQSGIIEEYPFTFDDLLKVYGELMERQTRIQRRNFLWKELPQRYQKLRNEIRRYFIAEVENYAGLNQGL